ncbi:MAG: hypothetical protein ACFFCM_14850, partial [Promethearchaeota archaeon]
MLNIKKVVLFKTGIGYFQRMGTIDLTQDKSVTFSFKKKTMNDLLATLSILTEKAKIAAISYEASDIDTEKALEGSLIKIPQIDAFITLIKQLIGTGIKIEFVNHVVEGKILGIQEYLREGKEREIPEPYVTICQKDGQIKNIKLLDITGPDATISLQDQKMQDELDFFINTIYLGKKKDNKTLTIYFDGDSPSEEVMIIYLQDTPSWKCSYRLISGMFEDDTDFYLQNYALVDNPLDEDWINVDLALVSGLPISFVYDLYSPNWITRSFKKPEKSYGLTAVEFEESEAEVGLLPVTEEAPAEVDVRKPPKKKAPTKRLGFASGPAVPPPPSMAPSPEVVRSELQATMKKSMRELRKEEPMEEEY